jgi:hypothetical protein
MPARAKKSSAMAHRTTRFAPNCARRIAAMPGTNAPPGNESGRTMAAGSMVPRCVRGA